MEFKIESHWKLIARSSVAELQFKSAKLKKNLHEDFALVYSTNEVIEERKTENLCNLQFIQFPLMKFPNISLIGRSLLCSHSFSNISFNCCEMKFQVAKTFHGVINKVVWISNIINEAKEENFFIQFCSAWDKKCPNFRRCCAPIYQEGIFSHDEF